MKKIIIAIMLVLIASLFFLNGCGETPLAKIRQNPENYLGKEVTTWGIVNSTTKILSFQVLKIQDIENQNSMTVYLQPEMSLPAEGSKIIVKGIVKHNLGYYIEATEIKKV